jgi:acetyltransferase-like isoleucine patch superfamily enzyme
VDPENNEQRLREHFPKAHFGRNAQLIGMRNIEIGEGSCVSDDVWLNVVTRDTATRLLIGRSVHIGRRSTISAAGRLEIGDYCLLAPNVYVSDTNHRYQEIGVPILCQGAFEDRSLTIEENCWLGINCAIVGALIIGRGSVVAANSVVYHDVPPFSVVAGIPATIVKMYDPLERSWKKTESRDDLAKVMESRERVPVLAREEHAIMLSKAGILDIHPAAMGSILVP